MKFKLLVVFLAMFVVGCGVFFTEDGDPTKINQVTADTLGQGKEVGNVVGGPLGLLISTVCGLGGVALAGVNRHQKKKAMEEKMVMSDYFTVVREAVDAVPPEAKEIALDKVRSVLSKYSPEFAEQFKLEVKANRRKGA